jgi:hypothetical protein
MKKLIIIIVTAFIPALIMAQGTPLSSLYNQYVSEPGYETTEILPGSVSYEWEKDMDISQVKEMMKSIDNIRILKYKSETDKSGQEKLWKKVQKASSDDLYTEVVTVNSDDMYLRMFMMKGSEGKTKEVALAVKDKDGVMLATMTGNMDFSAMFSPENMQAFREMGKYFMEQKGSCNHNEN